MGYFFLTIQTLHTHPVILHFHRCGIWAETSGELPPWPECGFPALARCCFAAVPLGK